MDPLAPSDAVLSALSRHGLTFLGIAGVEAETEEAQQRYRAMIAEGRHGTMTWMERHEALKYAPARAVPGTRSLIIAGLNYYQPRPESSPEAGKVARYAWGRDYHKVLLHALQEATKELAGLWPGEQFRCFTDTSPIDERFWAQEAGAAFIARNALAIHRELGSWFLLGEIFTSATLSPTPRLSHAHGSCPSSCRRCVDVCPTGALDGTGAIDATKCISYLTIEHKGAIPLELRPKIGAWLFGCDLCQEVCPFNLKVATTTENEFLAWKVGSSVDLAQILALPDEAAFTRRFGGSPVHRAGFQGLRRNACLVAGNTGAVALIPLLEGLTQAEDDVVADAATWALSVLIAEARS